MSDDTGTIVTDCREWAIRCYDRDGNLFTGRSFVTEREALESGKRLTQCNGADWWLVSRMRVVQVTTFPWENTDTTY